MIITLCGGGSTFTPGIVKSIALRKDELDVDEIRLYDINEERQRKIGVLVDWILHEDLGLDIKLTVTTDKETAFTDASFVFARCAWAAMPCASRTRRFRCVTAALARRPAAAAALPTACAPSSPWSS